SMAWRNAANVLPDPVGAEIKTSRLARISGQPNRCGSVTAANCSLNQRRTSGSKSVSGMVDPAMEAPRRENGFISRLPRRSSPAFQQVAGRISNRSATLPRQRDDSGLTRIYHKSRQIDRLEYFNRFDSLRRR